MPHLSSPLDKTFNRSIKRATDIVLSMVIIAALAVPVFLPIAIVTKITSPGPVIFRQRRTGYQGKDFYCYKFRSMEENEESDTTTAKRNDNRVTAIGRFMRRSSIDELPQLFNVVQGDMSLIGPRPHMLYQTERYCNTIRNYMDRHHVKPGITGLSQVNGLRGSTEFLWQMQKRVDTDLHYIKNWTILLDFKRLFKTIYKTLLFQDKNAY